MAIRSGFYFQREWPSTGSVTEEDNRIVECFRIIKDEEVRRIGAKAK